MAKGKGKSKPRSILKLSSIACADAEANGGRWARLTRPQTEFLLMRAAILLWRGGNQIGKSTALALDAIDYARGTHKNQLHRPPVRIMIIGPSWEQMEPLMRRIWELVPHSELSPKNAYDPGRGITGKPPRLLFVDGPGKGSVINFATYEQGPKRIAGATVHRLLMDEPPPENVYSEAIPRVLRYGGHVRIGFTPAPDMADVNYLRKLVADGEITELNAHLTAENCWPIGALQPWLTQKAIDDAARLWPARTRQMRLKGDWEPIIEGSWLSAFDDDCISEEAPPPGALLAIGGDHGTAPGKQRFVLAAIAGHETDRPRVWFMGEWSPEGYTLPEHDAKAILSMLEESGLEYDNVDEWVADRSAQSRSAWTKKSNARLRDELAKELGRLSSTLKWIHTPKKFEGSVLDGFSLFNALFARRDGPRRRPHALIHPRCKNLIRASREFKGKEKEPSKDILDAARYILERILRRRDWLDLPSVTAKYRIGG